MSKLNSWPDWAAAAAFIVTVALTVLILVSGIMLVYYWTRTSPETCVSHGGLYTVKYQDGGPVSVCKDGRILYP